MSNQRREDAGEPFQLPCIGCVKRLTSSPPKQDLPCLKQPNPMTVKCVMCARKRQKCEELPYGATGFGREFQIATIKRSEGEVVENWDILGEKTKQAIDQAERQAARREQQRPSISMADPYEAESSTEDSIWVAGQQQANPTEQQPPPQQPQQQPQQEIEQSNGEPQLVSEAVQQQLQIMSIQIQELRQALAERHQDIDGHQDERRDIEQSKSETQPVSEAVQQQLQEMSIQIQELRQALAERHHDRGGRQDERRENEHEPEPHGLDVNLRDNVYAAQHSRNGVRSIVIHLS